MSKQLHPLHRRAALLAACELMECRRMLSSISFTDAHAVPLVTARQIGAATTAGDYAIFVGGFGASGSAEISAYNSSNQLWTTSYFTGASAAGRNNLAATSLNGVAYLAGGYLGSGAATDEADTYDPFTDTLSQIQPLPSGPEASLAATSVDGLAFFAGGQDNGATSDIVNL